MTDVIGEAAIEIGADDSKFQNDLDKKTKPAAEKSGKKAGDSFSEHFKKALSKIGDVSSGAMLAFTALGSAAGGIASTTSALGSLSVAVTQSSGALALYPAAIAGYKIVSQTAQLAVNGVAEAFQASGEDLKKFGEALQGLSPNAQSFVLSLVSIKTAWEDVGSSVQDTFFKGLAEYVRPLGATYLPVVKQGLVGISEGLNLGARGLADWAAKSSTVQSVNTALLNVGASTKILAPAATNAAEALKIFLEAGMARLPLLAQAINHGSENLAAFMTRARDTGALREWISGGIESMKTLGDIASSTGSILSSIFKGLSTSSAASPLELLATTLAKVAEQVKQPAFVDGIRMVFEGISTGAAAAREALPAVGDALVALAPALSNAASVGGVAFGSMLTTIAQALIAVAPTLTMVTEALQPWAPLLGQLAPLLYAVSKATVVVSAATSAWTAIQKTHTAVLAAGGIAAYAKTLPVVTAATTLWAGAQSALNLVISANPIAQVIAVIAALVAGIVLAYQNSETFRNIVNAAWDAVKAGISAVASWITDTAVPAITGAWDKVSEGASWLGEKLSAVWNGVSSGVQTLGDTLSPIWDSITAVMQGVGDRIKSVWDGALGILKGVSDWISATFGPVFTTWQAIVVAAFQAAEILIRAWWEVQLKPIFEAAKSGVDALGKVFTWLYENAVKPAFDGVSAVVTAGWTLLQEQFNLGKTAVEALGKVFTWLHENAVKPAWDGICSAATAARDMLKSALDGISAGIAVVGNVFSTFYSEKVKPAWDNVCNIISTGWTTYISPVLQALQAGVGMVVTAFEKTVAGVYAAWNRLQEIAKVPVKFVIDTVLNNGLIRAFNWLGERVGGPHIDNIPLPFATGGVLPGYTPGRDVHRFYSPTAGALALSGGEAIMRPEFTRAVGGSQGVARLNALARRGVLGFAGGGVLDWVRSQGLNALGWVQDTSSDVWRALSDPLNFLRQYMPQVPSAGVLSDYANGAASRLLESAANKARQLFSDFIGAYNSVLAEFQATQAAQMSAQGGGGGGWARGGVLRPLVFDRGGVLPPGPSLVMNSTGGPERLFPEGAATYLDVDITVAVDDLAKISTVNEFLEMLANSRGVRRKTARSGKAVL